MTKGTASSSRGVLLFLVILGFALRCFLAFRPFGILDDQSLSDDSYISFLLARNIAKGLGPYYTSGFTNGFQPLQVFLLVPLYRFLPETVYAPVRGALLISAAFDALSAVVLYRWISAFSRSKWVAPLATFAWVIHPGVLQVSQNGLETSEAFFFILLSFAYSYWLFEVGSRLRSWKHFAVLGVILGGAMLARVDSAFLFPAILIRPLWRIWRSPVERVEMVRGVAALLISAALVYAPWAGYSYYYTGSVYQVSGSATRLIALSHIGRNPVFAKWISYTFSVALDGVWEKNRVIGFHIGVLFLALVLRAWKVIRDEAVRAWRIISPALVFSVILFSAYAFYMFAVWYFPRYLYPLILLVILLLAVLIDAVVSNIGSANIKKIIPPALALSLLLSTVFSADFHGLFVHEDRNSNGYMDVGLWARKQFPDGTKIGSSQSGALAYFADNLKVYNLDGVVNLECFHWLVQKRNMEYIRKEKIEYILGFRTNIDFVILNSADWSKDDLTFLGLVPNIASWGQHWFLYRVNQARGMVQGAVTKRP